MIYLAKKPFIVIFILTVLFVLILQIGFKIESTVVRTGIAAFLAVILSPRRKKIQTQAGEKTQITWVFLKKPVFID